MYLVIIIVFIFGYLCIALENTLKIDKAASAIVTGVLCWVLLTIGAEHFFEQPINEHFISEEILHHLGDIGGILFFLLGAMTIVEIIDAYHGFSLLTDKIKTADRTSLLWIVCMVTFFFSALLDNLTTSILMATLLKKLIHKKEDLWFFAGMVIIAANAGGAWSPIGDITTIMLWIGGQITAQNVVLKVFLPSIVCMLVPLLIVSLTSHKTDLIRPEFSGVKNEHIQTSPFEQAVVFWIGIIGLLFVPIFKNLTHLPPFMGILLSLGVLWITTELLHREKKGDQTINLSVAAIIRRVDTPSVLFFLGVLLAVASLQTAGHLDDMADLLNDTFGNIYIINMLIGLLSAIVDNVPLVAGAMGMYPLSTYPPDHTFWELLTYCAGTGGSTLIIGSAAGVAIMGILNIDFIWYLKKISWLALIGYFSGMAIYYLMNIFF
jgi:Na+/H+ antiporter NhaD/arsenite permease-like protein